MDAALLSKYGVKSPDSALASSLAGAQASARKIGFPVAMKAVSKKAVHKSEIGGVILGIRDAEEAGRAYSLLLRRCKGIPLEGILVQKMAGGPSSVELIVGGKRDAQFGQLIMLGLGGIFVEVFRDVSFRVCPITEADALEMMRELKSYPILAGARGRKPVNEKALSSTLVRVSNLLMKEDPAEFDINPLIADSKGCVAVDARMLR